jgi:hypothetical protein
MKDFSNASFPPETISIMKEALDAAIATLPDPISTAHVDSIAETILRTAKEGERDAGSASSRHEHQDARDDLTTAKLHAGGDQRRISETNRTFDPARSPRKQCDEIFGQVCCEQSLPMSSRSPLAKATVSPAST